MDIEFEVKTIDIITETNQVDIINEVKDLELLVTPVPLSGISAYQVAVKNGFTGTELEWLESLKVEGIDWNSTNW